MNRDTTRTVATDQRIFANPKPNVSSTVHVSESSISLLIRGVFVYHSAMRRFSKAFKPKQRNQIPHYFLTGFNM